MDYLEKKNKIDKIEEIAIRNGLIFPCNELHEALVFLIEDLSE